ncbi:MAG: GNAT family N-acetyltransferase [Pseudomonadota bacterium]
MLQTSDYTFSNVTATDIPLLARWLTTPDLRRWWGDPEEELAIIDEDRINPLMTTLLVHYRGNPFAYVQDYDVASWPQPHLRDLPAGTRAVQTFIGEPSMHGRGHAARYLRERIGQLHRDGVPVVAIDPLEENTRAVAAYRKAGFENAGMVYVNGSIVVRLLCATPRPEAGQIHAA